jgi:RIO-like serine/threonine protein kinase
MKVLRVLQNKGGPISPAVSLVEHEGRPAVLKDFRPKGAVTRGLIGPALVRREFAVLRALEGVPGIPRAYAVVEKRALLVEFVEGRTLAAYGAGELPDRVFELLCETVRAMHARRVVHLDLRQKRNIVIGTDRPWIVDFAGALRGRLAASLRAVDESALLKWKKRNWPHLVTPADLEALRRHKALRKFWIFTRPGESVR